MLAACCATQHIVHRIVSCFGEYILFELDMSAEAQVHSTRDASGGPELVVDSDYGLGFNFTRIQVQVRIPTVKFHLPCKRRVRLGGYDSEEAWIPSQTVTEPAGSRPPQAATSSRRPGRPRTAAGCLLPTGTMGYAGASRILDDRSCGGPAAAAYQRRRRRGRKNLRRICILCTKYAQYAKIC